MGRPKGSKNGIRNLINLKCLTCNKTFQVGPCHKSAKFCSHPCYSLSKIGIPHTEEHNRKIREATKKAQIPTRFKKGHNTWNKGLHIQTNTGRTHFKKGICTHPFPKGHIPWNKGKSHMLGEKHPNWKGGISISGGYTYIYSPNHPFVANQRYVLRSRLVAEKHLKRFLKPKEVVHHINGNTLDDRPENLYVFKNNSSHIHNHKIKHLKSNLL